MKHTELKNKTILVTGVAGFIGSNLAKRLLNENKQIKVVGIDNMNDYYDINLKNARLAQLNTYEPFTFVKGNFDGNFLQVAKATVTTSVFGDQATQTASLIVPCNMQIDSVNEGVIVLSGGRALTSLTSGTVIQNDENGLAVQVDDNLVVYYNGLVESFVSVGDIVSNNQLLGRYNGTVSASVTYNGQLVVDVVASQSAIQWSI